MTKSRRRYTRTTGLFYLRRWTERIAMKATERRLRQVDGLLIEIAGMWGEEEEYICRQMDELRDHIAEVTKLIVEGQAELAEQRRQDREAAI